MSLLHATKVGRGKVVQNIITFILFTSNKLLAEMANAVGRKHPCDTPSAFCMAVAGRVLDFILA